MGQTAKKRNKWVTFIIVCMTTGVITELPYLRWQLYEPLREALGQTNTEFGLSMSLFGVLAAICTYRADGLQTEFHTGSCLQLRRSDAESWDCGFLRCLPLQQP